MIRIPSILLAMALAACASSLFAASPLPAWAPHGMVTSAERHATEAGLRILEQGGNAVDAAAAVALALGVTESYSSGIGGGCFILIRLADGTAVAVDGRETAPARATRNMFVPRDTTKPSTLSTEGVLAAGVPGELAALDLAVRKYGRLPLAALLESAIALADTGFDVDMRYARALNTNRELLGRFEGSRAVFFQNDSLPLAFGDRLIQSDLAATLRRIQSEGIAAFYAGDLPKTVENYVAKNGGILTAPDFAAYVPLVREPVRGSYRGCEVLSMPPPSSGGVHVLQILNILEPFDLSYFGAGSSESVHLIAEAMQLAFADRAEFLGDPAFTRIPAQGLVSTSYADTMRAKINRLQHAHVAAAGNPWPFDHGSSSEDKHTTHLCVVDSEGNAVSLTATINTPFGSGVIVPGTGFLLNNEMDDFVTWPGQPNYFGLVGTAANEVEPGKRPLSSMSPTILVKDNRPFLVVGSMGGPRIITAVALAVINALDCGMTIQEAIDFPRFHQQWRPDELWLEQDYPADVVTALRDRGHTVSVRGRWAATMAIMADSTYGGWWGASDSRVSGLAQGY
ncbi:MAG: gamma-glutamyltransferase [bacterium]|nr:gamma-glutamyltransferase [bacterium]